MPGEISEANETNKPKWGIHPAVLLQRCQDCYTRSTEQGPKWWAELCTEPHLLVWAKSSNPRYWPAKVIATDRNKAVVYLFGKRSFELVDSADCTLYSLQDPNEGGQRGLEWMHGFLEADDYICRLIHAYGCFRYAGPNRPLDAATIQQHRWEVLPDAFARRSFRATAVSRGPVASGSRTLDPNQMGSDAQSRGRARHGGLNLPDTNAADTARPMETDEEVDVVTVDPPASAASQPPPPDAEELARAKKIVWCSVCETPAVMICCWSYFYCSEECFLRDSHRQVCRKPYMANHVAVARRSSPSILAPMHANIFPGARGAHNNVRQNAAIAFRPRPMPYQYWPNVRNAGPSARSTLPAGSDRPGADGASGSAGRPSRITNTGETVAARAYTPFDKFEVLAYAAAQFVKYSGNPPPS